MQVLEDSNGKSTHEINLFDKSRSPEIKKNKMPVFLLYMKPKC